jgi:hypothetical protein
LNIRRSKVIAALYWLNKHHCGYTDISIVEESLAWLDGNEERLLPDDQMRFVSRQVSCFPKKYFMQISVHCSFD